MPCFKPLSAWRGERLISGKRGMVFKVGSAEPALSAFMQKLPCGQCVGCRLDYSYDWAVRCVCEAQEHEDSCFVLLTYEKLPVNGSLQLKDFQEFMRRLRDRFGDVRYLHGGEYGTMNGRPHDHIVLFGMKFPDLKFFKVSNAGFKLYRSHFLETTWRKGHCSVGSMSFDAAGYVARYLMDKPTLTKAVKDENGITIGREYTEKAIAKYGETVDTNTGVVTLLLKPEYLTMSRRPGIAEGWLRKYWRDIYPHDFFVMQSGGKMPPPRYFDNKVEEWKVVDMEKIKLHRMSRCTSKEDVWNKFLEKWQLLSCDRDERLIVKEVVKKAQLALYNSERGDYLI